MTDYSTLKVAELKELAGERDIPLAGLSKKQQFIDALEAKDAEASDDADEAGASTPAKAPVDYSKMKVPELKKLCSERSLPTPGLKKQQMVELLETYDAEESNDADEDNDKSQVKKTGNKRVASPDSVPGPAKKPKKDPDVNEANGKAGDAQYATPFNSGKLQVPVDEHCGLGTSYSVYIDPGTGIIYDASLNQTNSSNNNNKFYRVQLLGNPSGHYMTWTRWGRVGEIGQSAVLGDGSFGLAMSQFEKKFKDKSGLSWSDRGETPKPKKYVFVERSYLPDEEDDAQAEGGAPEGSARSPTPECTLAPPVQSLMELIFNQKYFAAAMESLNYDANKMPLGKLSKAIITQGFQILKDLSEEFDNSSLAAGSVMTGPNIEDLSNAFYSRIPHSFGRSRPPIINTHDRLKREIELLESLSDLKDADNIIKAEKKREDKVNLLDSRFQGLGMQEMTPLTPKSDEFTAIEQYLLQTRGETHNIKYAVEDIFRIERAGEFDRFEKSPYANVASDRRLLWHGSRATNFGGILSQGLRIAPPEAPVNGYMFDKGIYLADMSSKSAGYCCPYDSGGHALLLLCEAELGKPMQVLDQAKSDAGSEAKKMGALSTWGRGKIGPKGWKDAKCVHESLSGVMMPDTSELPGLTVDVNEYRALYYNEYICYDVAQVRLRYLLRVRT